MIRQLAILLTAFLLVLFDTRADSPKKSVFVTPPKNIRDHYQWCLVYSNHQLATARFEKFYAKYHPTNENYKNSLCLRYVRLCAYRLVELYAEAGNKKEMKNYLLWLQRTDHETQIIKTNIKNSN